MLPGRCPCCGRCERCGQPIPGIAPPPPYIQPNRIPNTVPAPAVWPTPGTSVPAPTITYC